MYLHIAPWGFLELLSVLLSLVSSPFYHFSLYLTSWMTTNNANTWRRTLPNSGNLQSIRNYSVSWLRINWKLSMDYMSWILFTTKLYRRIDFKLYFSQVLHLSDVWVVFVIAQTIFLYFLMCYIHRQSSRLF